MEVPSLFVWPVCHGAMGLMIFVKLYGFWARGVGERTIFSPGLNDDAPP
jgi:hypothetical protein